jgi:hypothetical protein
MSAFALFLLALVFFHTSEFCLAAIYNRKELDWRCKHGFYTPPMTLANQP